MWIIAVFMLAFQSQSHAQKWGNYTLIAVQNTNTASLIDTNGKTYHTWTLNIASKTGYSSYLLPGGVLLRTISRSGNSFSGGPICGEVQKVAWDGTVIWDYVYSTPQYCSHHDICPMPNGNVLLIAYESKTPAEVALAGCTQSITMWPDKIVEIQPNGTNGGSVVWEWRVWDHLVQSVDSNKNNYKSSIANNPQLLNINYKTTKDWMHVNGVDYNPELDQIVFSSHNMNEIYVIDHSTTIAEATSHSGGRYGKGGDFLYRWGNPSAYNATGTIIFNVVHDAHWIRPDCPNAGYLVGFNNNGISQVKSSVDFISPPYTSDFNYSKALDSAFSPTTFTWRHPCNGHCFDEGNSQQLPNGNMLVCIAQSGYIYEIDPQGNTIWSKTVAGSMIAKAFRYTECYVNGSTPASVSISATKNVVCLGNSTQLSATASGGISYSYSWTSNPPGFTSTSATLSVTPTITTTYFISVLASGCSVSNSTTSAIMISVNPTLFANAGTGATICKGQNVILNGSGTGGIGAFTYSWLPISGLSSTTVSNPKATPTQTTIYTLTVSSGGCSTTASVVVNILPLPATPKVSQTGDTLFSSAVFNNQWFFNGTAVTGATGNFIIPAQAGNYQTQVIGLNGCYSELSVPFNYKPDGIVENIQIDTPTIIFPNPTDGIINFSGFDENESLEVFVFDILGNLLISSDKIQPIDISHFQSGVFVVKICSHERKFLFCGRISLLK